jgi:hypothetical protein
VPRERLNGSSEIGQGTQALRSQVDRFLAAIRETETAESQEIGSAA